MSFLGFFKRTSPAGRQADHIKVMAEAGDAEAQFVLGDLYRKGDGVKQSYSQALFWFEKSAHGGDIIGQLNLATMLITGQAGKQDLVEGYKWVVRASWSSKVMHDPEHDKQIRSEIAAVREWLEKRLTIAETSEGKRRALKR